MMNIETIKQNTKFKKYYELLVQENQKYNLTSITDEEEVYYKHFLDCATILNYFDLNDKIICDVGSGAGFPGMVLKILCPSMKLYIVEPLGKRCKFLELVKKELGLKDVFIINDRVEKMNEYRECFDIVFARAVSNLSMLIELCIPIVKVKGYFVSMKGSNYQEEVNLASNALKKLDSKIENIYEYQLGSYGVHSLIKILKDKKTSGKYPRSYAKIKNDTL